MDSNASIWFIDQKVDSFGNLYLSCSFITENGGNVDLDPGGNILTQRTVDSTIEDGHAIIKLDSNFNLLWVDIYKVDKHLLSYLDIDVRLALDADQNLIASLGLYDSTVLTKYNHSGTRTWSFGFNNKNTIFYSLKTDQDGNIFVGGYLYDSVDIDPSGNRTVLEGEGYYIAKYNTNGAFLWFKQFEGKVEFSSVQTDSDGSHYIAGTFNYEVRFDLNGDQYTSGMGIIPLNDAFLLKLDSAGNTLSIKTWSAPGLEGNTGIHNVDLKVLTDGYFRLIMTSQYPIAFEDRDNYFNTPLNKKEKGTLILDLDPSGKVINAVLLAGIQSLTFTDQYIYGLDFTKYLYKPYNPEYLNIQYTNNKSYDLVISKFDLEGQLFWSTLLGTSGEEIYGQIQVHGSRILVGSNANSLASMVKIGSEDSIQVLSAKRFPESQFTFIIEMSEDSCSNNSIVIESVQNGDCNHASVVTSRLIGKPQLSNWEITGDSLINDSTVMIYYGGVYSSRAQFGSCVLFREYYLDGPSRDVDLDMKSTLAVSNVFRPGFNTTINMSLSNTGCTPSRGKYFIVLDPKLNYDTSSIIPEAIINDTLFFAFEDLVWSTEPTQLSITVKTDTSATEGETIVLIKDILLDEGLTDSTSNYEEFEYLVTLSYDPNYLKLLPDGICKEDLVKRDEIFDFTVHFQNEGNGEAVNIYLLNNIDSSLDINSFHISNSSHPIDQVVIDKHKVGIYFDSIMLASKFVNPDSSQGFVQFSLKARDSIADWQAISNSTSIYFDFNKAVETNKEERVLVSVLPELSTKVLLQNGSLIAVADNAFYRWMKCEDGAHTVIDSANESTYTPAESGYYSVEISVNGCTDTSLCFYIDKAGISESNPTTFHIYPNPSTGLVAFHFDRTPEIVQVFDIKGNLVYANTKISPEYMVDLSYLANGVYYIEALFRGTVIKQKLLIMR